MVIGGPKRLDKVARNAANRAEHHGAGIAISRRADGDLHFWPPDVCRARDRSPAVCFFIFCRGRFVVNNERAPAANGTGREYVARVPRNRYRRKLPKIYVVRARPNPSAIT